MLIARDPGFRQGGLPAQRVASRAPRRRVTPERRSRRRRYRSARRQCAPDSPAAVPVRVMFLPAGRTPRPGDESRNRAPAQGHRSKVRYAAPDCRSSRSPPVSQLDASQPTASTMTAACAAAVQRSQAGARRQFAVSVERGREGAGRACARKRGRKRASPRASASVCMSGSGALALSESAAAHSRNSSASCWQRAQSSRWRCTRASSSSASVAFHVPGQQPLRFGMLGTGEGQHATAHSASSALVPSSVFSRLRA